LNGPQFDNMDDRKPCIKISCKSDVWSLGCILYQLTYGKMPFGDIKHPLMKLQAITNIDYPIQFPTLPDGDPILISVIQACLVRDPGARPSIAELLNHRYVTGVEVAKEEEKKLDPPSAVKMISIKYKVTIGSQQNYREI
jgi:serine/threonine protein kinase